MIVAYKWNASPRAGSYAHDTQHEKIIRGVAIGMALIMCVLNPPNLRPRPPASGKPLGTAVGGTDRRQAWRRGWDAIGTRFGRGQGHRRLQPIGLVRTAKRQLIGKRLSFGVLCRYGREESADTLIEQLTLDKDPILRWVPATAL